MAADPKTLLDLLMELLFVSLLVERVVAVIWQGINGAREGDDVNAWTRKHIAVALAVSAVVCITYDLDILEIAMTEPAEWYGVGMAFTALVLTGGSAGIRKIADAVSEMAKASKNEAQARGAAAKAASAALQPRPMVAHAPLAVGYAAPSAIAPAAPAVATTFAGVPNVSDSTAQRIIDECESTWPRDSGDCSAFVRDVCAALGVNLQGNADAIVTTITGPGWDAVPSGAEAKRLADAGRLVVAGLKSTNHLPPRQHGHVAIVVSGPLEHGKYPAAYWGSLGGSPGKYRGTNWAWNGADRDRVAYAARAI